MKNVVTQFEKGLEKLKAVLDLIEAGTYSVNPINGEISKGDKVIKGAIGSQDMQKWYSLSGITVQGYRLCYSLYHGITALDEDKVVKHLDDDKMNNGITNLIQVSKKGWKAELEELRGGVGLMETPPVEELEAVAQQEVVTLVSPIDTVKIFTGDELVARAVIIELNKGQTVKQVALNYDLKESKVRDIKRGKSSGKATAELRAE